MKSVLTVKIVIFCVCLSLENNIRNDRVLVVPGTGAENVLLNDKADTVINVKGYPDKVSEFRERKEVFADIFNVKSAVRIYYDKIYFYRNLKAVIFLDSGIVSGIAGLSSSRISSDSVDLSRGVDYFVFSYGNRGQELIKKDRDSIYFYSNKGIAVVDDNCDDSIDMYFVFSCSP